jgi:hypothetical protein
MTNTTTENDLTSEPNAMIPEKGVNLLIIGIILLSVVIVADALLRIIFACKNSKQKRAIAPCPEGMMAAVIVAGGAQRNNERAGRGIERTLEDDMESIE